MYLRLDLTCKPTVVVILRVTGAGGAAAAAQSVNALYFQHEGTRSHVIGGWSRPNSFSITEIPQTSSILELELVATADTCF